MTFNEEFVYQAFFLFIHVTYLHLDKASRYVEEMMVSAKTHPALSEYPRNVPLVKLLGQPSTWIWEFVNLIEGYEVRLLWSLNFTSQTKKLKLTVDIFFRSLELLIIIWCTCKHNWLFQPQHVVDNWPACSLYSHVYLVILLSFLKAVSVAKGDQN